MIGWFKEFLFKNTACLHFIEYLKNVGYCWCWNK